MSLLSGRSALSLHSQMTLAEAVLLLSELRGTGSQTLHLLTQKLLQQQVSDIIMLIMFFEALHKSRYSCELHLCCYLKCVKTVKI